MKFVLSDLRRARFPDPIAKGCQISFPGFTGKVSKCDGRFFKAKRKLGMDLKHVIMFDDQFIPVDQVYVAFQPGDSATIDITDQAIERFHMNGDLTLGGLQAALSQPDVDIPPSYMKPPAGPDTHRAYFARHEPYVHTLLTTQPDVLWRAYYRGAIPSTFSGFEQDYQQTVLGKMVSYWSA
jgi:hypothetical protein